MIEDNFLNFWFRFVFKYQSALEINQFTYVKDLLKRDFRSYAGRVLEKWFRNKLTLSSRYTRIGNYWDNKGQNEIDIVAIDEAIKLALIAEVKFNKEKANLELLKQKSHKIMPLLKGYTVSYRILGLEDMK